MFTHVIGHRQEFRLDLPDGFTMLKAAVGLLGPLETLFNGDGLLGREDMEMMKMRMLGFNDWAPGDFGVDNPWEHLGFTGGRPTELLRSIVSELFRLSGATLSPLIRKVTSKSRSAMPRFAPLIVARRPHRRHFSRCRVSSEGRDHVRVAGRNPMMPYPPTSCSRSRSSWPLWRTTSPSSTCWLSLPAPRSPESTRLVNTSHISR